MEILISACLLGIDCKYNGENNYKEEIVELLKEHTLIPVCPEQLGGLPTPREPVELIRKHEIKAVKRLGEDVTSCFLKGANETLKIARLFDAKIAILKENSPSCGNGTIYDGTFSGEKVKGNGLTAELLKKEGIKILGESQIKELKKALSRV